MSLGCWFLTLRMRTPASRNRDFPYITGDFIQTFRLAISKNHLYLGLEAKYDKSKTTLFSQTFKVSKDKVPSFFQFLASRLRY